MSAAIGREPGSVRVPFRILPSRRIKFVWAIPPGLCAIFCLGLLFLDWAIAMGWLPPTGTWGAVSWNVKPGMTLFSVLVLGTLGAVSLGVSLREVVWLWPSGSYHIDVFADGLVMASPLRQRHFSWTELPPFRLEFWGLFMPSQKDCIIARQSRFRSARISLSDFASGLEGWWRTRGEAFLSFVNALHEQGQAGALGANPIAVPPGLVVAPLALTGQNLMLTPTGTVERR